MRLERDCKRFAVWTTGRAKAAVMRIEEFKLCAFYDEALGIQAA